MNGFDVQAVGWVVTRDFCYEALRACLGAEPTLERTTIQELANRWRNVAAAVAGGRQALPYGARFFWQSKLLSSKSETALREFIERLIDLRPDRYAHPALRSRSVAGFIQAIAFLLGFLGLRSWASAATPTLDEIAFVSLLMGCWSLATTLQLRRMCYVIRRLDGRQVPSAV